MYPQLYACTSVDPMVIYDLYNANLSSWSRTCVASVSIAQPKDAMIGYLFPRKAQTPQLPQLMSAGS